MTTTANGDDNANTRAKEIPPARRAVSRARSRKQLGAATPLPQAFQQQHTRSHQQQQQQLEICRAGVAAVVAMLRFQPLRTAAHRGREQLLLGYCSRLCSCCSSKWNRTGKAVTAVASSLSLRKSR